MYMFHSSDVVATSDTMHECVLATVLGCQVEARLIRVAACLGSTAHLIQMPTARFHVAATAAMPHVNCSQIQISAVAISLLAAQPTRTDGQHTQEG
jgi:hypothetical protein